jgi:hypothetical protein
VRASCSIQALLSAPNPDDPLAENVAKHWKENEAEAVETGGRCSSSVNSRTTHNCKIWLQVSKCSSDKLYQHSCLRAGSRQRLAAVSQHAM